MGAMPWIPKVNLHNPFLALANGDDFLKPFHQAAESKIENYILVVEGSIPNELNKEEDSPGSAPSMFGSFLPSLALV
jgi:hydrogenase small subunit